MTKEISDLKELTEQLQELLGKPYETQLKMYNQIVEKSTHDPMRLRHLPALRGVKTSLLAYLLKTKILTESSLDRFTTLSLGGVGHKLIKSTNTRTDKQRVYEYAILMFIHMIDKDTDIEGDVRYLYMPQWRFLVAAQKTFKIKTAANYPAFNEPNIDQFSTGVGIAVSSIHDFLAYNTDIYNTGITFALDQLIAAAPPVKEMTDRQYNALALGLYGLNAIYSQSCHYADIQLVALLKQFRPDFLPLITPCLSCGDLVDNIDYYLAFDKESGRFEPGKLLQAHLMASRQLAEIGEDKEMSLIRDRGNCAAALLAVRECIDPSLGKLKPSSQELLAQVANIHQILLKELSDSVTGHDSVKEPLARITHQLTFMSDMIERHPILLGFDVHSIYSPPKLNAMTNALGDNIKVMTEAFKASEEKIVQLIGERKLAEVAELTADMQTLAEAELKEFTTYLNWMTEAGERMMAEFDQLSQAKEKKSEQNDEAELLRVANANLHTEISKLQNQISKQNTMLDDVHQKVTQTLRNQEAVIAPALRELLFAKSSLAQVLETFTQLYPDVILSDNFGKMFEQCHYQDPLKLFKFLVILREDYFTRCINGEPDSTTKELFGDQIFKANESNTVLNSDKLRRQREFRFDGENVLMTKHLTLGNLHDPQRTVQIHFDILGSRLRIGRIGEHLPL